jgi:gliding motility-associated-like protein
MHFLWNTTPPLHTALVNNIGSGTYIVTATDSVGCIGHDTVTVTDFDPPVVSAGNDIEICQGETTTLTASGALVYVWQPSGTLSCSSCIAPVANPTTTTGYRVIGKDGNGCADTGFVTIHVIEKVEVTVDSARNVCLGDKVMLGATGGTYYNWTPAGSLLGPFLPNPIASPQTTTTYQVIITENRCFTDTLYQTVTVLPLPAVDIMPGFFAIPGAIVRLTTTTANASTITWAPPEGLSCTDCFQPLATLQRTIIYIAEVTDNAGCKARDTIRIVVGCNQDAFFMANTFTPNNDGRNDYFYPQGLGVNMIHRFMIYNRWGEIVFSATDIPVNTPERGWDGTYHGKEVPPDVFMYVLEAVCPDGTPIVVKGDITVVR